MSAAGVDDYRSYLDLLQAESAEFPRLLDTILINVTSFFRDPPAWKVLAEKAIPGILDAKDSDAPVRVWSAGCSSGEEAYTIAMVFAEIMGPDQAAERLKIYATDIGDGAFDTGRSARFTARDLEEVPSPYRDRYFSDANSHSPRPYVFDRTLRKTLIFGHHDLLSDPPISKLDLVVCRNTLMYFNADSQRQVLRKFHFALNDGTSVLFLGKAESLMTGSTMFEPVSTKVRIFRKLGQTGAHEVAETVEQGSGGGERREWALSRDFRSAVFDAGETAQLIVGRSGMLSMASAKAREIFGLTPEHVGRRFSELTASYSPVEFRSLIDLARETRKPIRRGPLEWPRGRSAEVWVQITVTPLFDSEGAYIGAKLEIDDVTELHLATEDLRRAQQDLETFQEELQSSNEELEAANEELQSTIEELETTNEELQSTNEELETMNEEIQSTNEELNTANVELTRRSDEADRANQLLSDVTSGLVDAMVVVGADLEVQIWSSGASDLWGGVSSEETVGRQFFDLDTGLPVDDLRSAVERCRNGSEERIEQMLDAMDRRGKTITVRAVMRPLRREEATDGILIAMNVVTN